MAIILCSCFMAKMSMPPIIPVFKLAEYDRLYEQSLKLSNGPERDQLYRQMARLLEFYSPVQMISSRYRNVLAQPACDWL